MTRTNMDIDDQASADTASVEKTRSLRGIGWEGDLDAIRSSRAPQHSVDSYHGRFRPSGSQTVSHSQTVSRQRRQPVATAQNSFKHPRGQAKNGEPNRHHEDGRRISRFSNRLTFSKCLTMASTAGSDRPKQLQTPSRTGEERRDQSTTRKLPEITASQTVSHSQTVTHPNRRRVPSDTCQSTPEWCTLGV